MTLKTLIHDLQKKLRPLTPEELAFVVAHEDSPYFIDVAALTPDTERALMERMRRITPLQRILA